jgi:two-component system sensor histidine kinase KdpD
MTRLESGVRVNKEWQPLEEVLGAALTRLERRLEGRPVTLDVPADLPLVPIDGVVLELVVTNLLENAVKHTPAGTPIEIAARQDGESVRVSIADRGPGFQPGDEAKVFENSTAAAPRAAPRAWGSGSRSRAPWSPPTAGPSARRDATAAGRW